MKILALFCNFVAFILDYNCMKDLRVAKIVETFKFEGAWGELEARNCF